MQLQLLDGDGKFICEMDNDTAVLGSYPVENGHKIHVCDHECTDFIAKGITEPREFLYRLYLSIDTGTNHIT